MEPEERWQPTLKVYCPLKAGSIDGTDTRPHDKAVERAMKAIYKPNKNVHGDPECTLFVGRLDLDTSENTLKKIFSKHGDIHHIRLIRDIVTGLSKQYAFVEFTKQRYAARALRATNHLNVEGREILVDWECERDLPKWIPRRLGGGFGGKKESGQLRFGGVDRPFRRPIVINRDNPGRDRSSQSRHRDDQRAEFRMGEGDRYTSREDDRARNREGDRARNREDDRDLGREGDRDRRDRDRRIRDDERRYDRPGNRDRHRDRDTDRYPDRESNQRDSRDRISQQDRRRLPDDNLTKSENASRSQDIVIKTEPHASTEPQGTALDSIIMNIKQEKL